MLRPTFRCLAAASAASLVSLSPAGPLSAQDALEPGTRSIALEVPDSESIGYGIWRARSPRTNLGLNFTIEVVDRSVERPDQPDQESTEWRLAFGPAVKYYLASRPVAPHLRGDLAVGIGRADPGGGRTDRTALLRVAGALGADWFPVERLSLGGHTGLELDYSRRTERGPALDRVTRVVRFGTFTSALTLHFYF